MKKCGWIVVVLVLFLIPLAGHAQCAMCRAVAETSHDGGSSVADGLNSGIMYLMVFPYILMGAVGFAIYKHKKQRS